MARGLCVRIQTIPQDTTLYASSASVIECDYYDPPAYTERDSELHSVGDKVTYTCTDDDTWFSPGEKSMTTTCGSDGEWSPEIRPCECENRMLL